MDARKNLSAQLKHLRGKTIAIVYIFEKEDAAGFQHYWVWKSDIISGWLNAVQELGCLPFILDVRTFIQKAINRELPHIDYVLNLNCGSQELSPMSLIPAMCGFLAIPCIPCNAASILMSENKQISNIIAEGYHIQVPETMDRKTQGGIFRPLNLGSSIGIKLGCPTEKDGQGTYQEFIPGYDITVPLLYNPDIHDLDILPPIIYIPHNLDPKWIYDAQEKVKDDGFRTYPLMSVEDRLRERILDFARAFPIQTYGRIDMRLKTEQDTLSHNIIKRPLKFSDVYFVEINAMPTIEKEDSFEYAIQAAMAAPKHGFYRFANEYYTTVSTPTVNGFLLACSMLAFTTRY